MNHIAQMDERLMNRHFQYHGRGDIFQVEYDEFVDCVEGTEEEFISRERD